MPKLCEQAIGKYLENEKAPSRKVNQIDNRGSSFYLAMYWAQALAEQNSDSELKERFSNIAKKLSENEEKINGELLGAQGKPVDLDGYYMPDPVKTEKEMRPSATFNQIIDTM